MFESPTRHIPELEGAGGYGEWIVDRESKAAPDDPMAFPFVGYNRAVRAVEEAVYEFVDNHPEFELTNYAEILESKGLKWDMESMKGADISAFDGQCVVALLLAASRADRFCEGALLEFFESGCVLRWLHRLREIDEASARALITLSC
ncbi:MAG: DUF6508 domain-containing protein [Eggerthellales bacterium]|nr:DUF6508 domain-containing protein [Eggerthellales bacterium]